MMHIKKLLLSPIKKEKQGRCLQKKNVWWKGYVRFLTPAEKPQKMVLIPFPAV